MVETSSIAAAHRDEIGPPPAMEAWTRTRRDMLKGIAAGTALVAAPIRAIAPSSPAAALLDRLAWQLLEFEPGDATRLGVDTGAHAALRSRLADRSSAGLAARGRFLSSALTALARVPRGDLDQSTLTSLAVTETAFRTALDGMALPYGVATIGSWRNTPYGVVQNVGAWLDVPQLLDGEQPVHDAGDADAYLARLSAMDAQLDGETARIRDARLQGLVPPSFLLDKTVTAMTRTLAEASHGDGPLIGPLARKTAAIPGDWTARADRIVRGSVVPALERQLAEIRAQRAVATDLAGSRRARTAPNGMLGDCAPARPRAVRRPIFMRWA